MAVVRTVVGAVTPGVPKMKQLRNFARKMDLLDVAGAATQGKAVANDVLRKCSSLRSTRTPYSVLVYSAVSTTE